MEWKYIENINRWFVLYNRILYVTDSKQCVLRKSIPSTSSDNVPRCFDSNWMCSTVTYSTNKYTIEKEGREGISALEMTALGGKKSLF